MSTKQEEILETWAEFFVSHALATKRIESRLAESAPLSLGEYDLLLSLSRSPEFRMRFSDLAQRMVYTKSGVTRMSRRLEESGFISRKECEKDRRVVYAVLTEKGKGAMRDTWRVYRAAILELLGPVYSAAEIKQLGDLLSQLTRALEPPALVRLGRSSE